MVNTEDRKEYNSISEFLLDEVMPRFMLMGMSYQDFWKFTPLELEKALRYQLSKDESDYDGKRLLAYMTVIMNLEGQAGKFKSFSHYFADSKLGKRSDKVSANQIKINMLNYANAVNQRNKQKRREQ